MAENVTFLALHQRNKELDSKLQMEGKSPAATVSNLLLIFSLDPLLAEAIIEDNFRGGMVLRKAVPPIDDIFAERAGPYPRLLDDADVAQMLAYIQHFHISRCKKGTLEMALAAYGKTHLVHPVIDWLNTLEWDGQPRLDSWLTQVYGAPFDDYHRGVGSKLLIAAVRRVRSPGCKFDQMIILEGNQGIGKSRSLKVLFGPDWFTDQISSPASKDASIDMRGKWCIEFGEIDQIIRSEVETVKAFLSRSVDHYRPVFGRISIDHPRQCVFIGTTNSDDYLRDPTGNRRFWPVNCRSIGTVDVAWLENNREQLWAEAAAREAADERIWLDDHLVQQAEEHQESRLQVDPWHTKIEAFIHDRSRIEIYEIMTECLLIPYAQQTKAFSNRIASILRILGWTSVTRKNSQIKKTERFWAQVTHPDEDM